MGLKESSFDNAFYQNCKVVLVKYACCYLFIGVGGEVMVLARIEEISIKNFLSLRDISIRLKKLNVLIGPNASGKSNIVKALRLLSFHAEGKSFLGLGFREFREISYNFDEFNEITLSVIISSSSNKVKYDLVLYHDGYEERAYIIEKNRQILILEHKGNTRSFTYMTKNQEMMTAHVPNGSISYFGKISVSPSAVCRVPGNSVNELKILSKVLQGIRTYSFSPEHIRARSEITNPPVLGYFGQNLARVLLHLYLEEREKFQEIERLMQVAVGIKEIIPHLEKTQVYVWVREHGLAEPLRPYGISDGTLRILAFITALLTGGSLVAFEEPENCVHPHLLETIVDLTRKAPVQVLITTQSPYLLDHVDVSEVFVVEKKGTETVIWELESKEEIKRVRKFLEEGGTLGEAWYSGMFGGVPR